MKVGQFSERTGVSRNTIRYYVSIGLLNPRNSGSQNNFTERELSDMKLIQRLKYQRFTLNEIQDIMAILRGSNRVEPETMEYLVAALKAKKIEIDEEAKELKNIQKTIDADIVRVSSSYTPRENRKTGLPLRALPLLVCPRCGKRLKVVNAEIDSDCIFSGELRCECGMKASIENGIVKTGNLYIEDDDQPDLRRGVYQAVDFRRSVHLAYNYIESRLQQLDLSDKVIMESNVNGVFYLFNHLELVPDDCLIIVTDKYPETLEMYKHLIEMLDIERDIVYIADASCNYPLKPGCVDLYISFISENEHQLYHQNTFIEECGRYFKEDSEALGVYIDYGDAPQTYQNLKHLYPHVIRPVYSIEHTAHEYHDMGFDFQMTELNQIDSWESKEYAFQCNVKGEAVRVWGFDAIRNAGE
ncbi:MAG: MerR family transcriptional regulator [Eubacteriales bacterium]|nr:MerR family transcriptional regulator [Eubacteriales bacterium]